MKIILFLIVINILRADYNIEIGKSVDLSTLSDNKYVLKLESVDDVLLSKYLYLEIDINASFNITVINTTSNQVLHSYNNGHIFFFGKSIIPFKKGYNKKDINIIISTNVNGNKINGSILYYFQDYKSVDFKDSINFISYFADNIDILVTKNNTNTIDYNRIQFYTLTSLKDQKKVGGEYLKMLINKSLQFPSSSSYDMTSSGDFFDGVIKTISQKDNFFCKEETCEYRIRIQVNLIESLTFESNYMKEIDEFKLYSDNINIFEEILQNEKITYKINIEDHNDKNFNFELESLKNECDIYINFNYLPNELNEYKYYSNEKYNEVIYINRSEIKEENVKYVYVTLFSKSESIASLKVSATSKNYVNKINLETNYKGFINNSDIKNYLLSFDSKYTEEINVMITLSSEYSNANIYLKECISGSECLITNDDTLKAQILEKSNNVIFRYSKNANNNEIYLQFICNKDKKNINDTSNIQISSTCNFAFAVAGSSSSYVDGTPYSFIVSGFQNHRNLVLSENKMFEIYENKQIYIRFNLSKDTLNSLKIKKIIFNIYSTIGDCKIYLSRLNPYPSEDDYIKVLEFNNNKNQINVYKQSIQFKIDELELSGDYYFAIEATDYSLINIEPVYESDYNPDLLKTEKLIDSISIKRVIGITGRSNFYIQNLLKNNIDIIMNIIIKSVYNKFKICVQIGKNEFDPNKSCDYSSYTNKIIISSKDKEFLYNGEYSVTIIDTQFDKSDDTLKSFEITFYYSHSDKPIEMKVPGQSSSLIVNSKNYILYNIDITMAKEYAVIILDVQTTKIFAFGSTSITSPNENDADFTLSYSKNTILLKNSYLRNNCSSTKRCVIYLNIVSNDINDSKFNLSYTVDNYNFILYDGYQFLTFTQNEDLYYKYKVDKKYPTNISLSSYGGLVSCEIKIGSNNEREINNLPLAYKIEDTLTNDITIPKGSYNNISNPVLYLKFTVSNYNKAFSKEEKDNFVYFFRKDLPIISITNKITELKSLEPVERFLRKGTFNYYYITLEEEQDFFISLINKSGESDLYINYDEYNYPNLSNYYKKSVSFKGDELSILKKEFIDKKLKFPKTWVIGVYARQDSKYSLVYAKNFNKYIKIKKEKMNNIKVNPKSSIYLSYYNTKDIDIYFYLWSDKTNININLDVYDESKGENLLDNTDESDFKSIGEYLYKSPPFIKKIDHSEHKCNNCIYIFEIENKSDNSTNIISGIFDDKGIIEIPVNKITDIVLPKDGSIFFKFDFSKYSSKITYKFEVQYGEIEYIEGTDYYLLQNKDILTDQNRTTLKKSEHIIKEINVNKNVKDLSQFEIFDSYYLKVSVTELTKIRVHVKTNNSFIELKDGVPFNYKTSTTENLYFFYQLDTEEQEKNNFVYLSIKHDKRYDLKENYYFLSSDLAGLDLDNESLFMPISAENKFNLNLGLIQTSQIKSKAKTGVYLIKIPKTNEVIDIQVDIKIEDNTDIKENSLVLGHLKVNEDSIGAIDYHIHIPSKGQFKISEYNCYSNINLDYKIINGNAKVVDNYNSNAHTTKDNTLLMEHNRKINYFVFDIYEPTAISLNLRSNYKGINKYLIKNDFFTVQTEFKPEGQNLYLKEYFNTDNIESYLHLYDKELTLKVKLFKVIDQFKIDFPHIDIINVILDVHIHCDKNSKDNLCHFTATPENSPTRKYQTLLGITRNNNFQYDPNNNNFIKFKFNVETDNINTEKDIIVDVVASVYLVENEKINLLESQFAIFPMANLHLETKRLLELSAHHYIGIIVLFIILTISFWIYCKNEENNTKTKKDGKQISKPEPTFQKINRVEMSISDNNK